MTAEQQRYLTIQAEEYVDRISRKARLHNVGLRIESQAALTASLVCLHQALEADGDAGVFRGLVNDVASDVVEKAGHP